MSIVTSRWIPRGEQGTRATVAAIAEIAAQGPDINGGIHAACLDHFMRLHWRYVEDGEHELIRTIPKMLEDFKRTGYFEGDCDDAAALACWFLIREFKGHATIVAARPPGDPLFRHVFVMAESGPLYFRIDPTAPRDADYTHWEFMVRELF